MSRFERQAEDTRQINAKLDKVLNILSSGCNQDQAQDMEGLPDLPVHTFEDLDELDRGVKNTQGLRRKLVRILPLQFK